MLTGLAAAILLSYQQGQAWDSDALVMLMVDGQICLCLRILESNMQFLICVLMSVFFWPAVKPPVTKMLMLVFLRGFVILICEVCMLMTSIGLYTLLLKNLSFSYIYSCWQHKIESCIFFNL